MSTYDNESELLRIGEPLTLLERLRRERKGELRSAVSTRSYYRIGEEDKEVVRRDSVVRGIEDARQKQPVLNTHNTDKPEMAPNVVASDEQTVVDLKALKEQALIMLEDAFEEAA